jgi:hypothetical protein
MTLDGIPPADGALLSLEELWAASVAMSFQQGVDIEDPDGINRWLAARGVDPAAHARFCAQYVGSWGDAGTLSVGICLGLMLGRGERG